MKSSSEIELSFHGLTEKKDVLEKVVEMGFLPLEKALDPIELADIRSQVMMQLQEDPYLRGKLDRIFGLLEKHI